MKKNFYFDATADLIAECAALTGDLRHWSQAERGVYCDGELADIVAELTARGHDDVWPRWVETGIWTLDGE